MAEDNAVYHLCSALRLLVWGAWQGSVLRVSRTGWWMTGLLAGTLRGNVGFQTPEVVGRIHFLVVGTEGPVSWCHWLGVALWSWGRSGPSRGPLSSKWHQFTCVRSCCTHTSDFSLLRWQEAAGKGLDRTHPASLPLTLLRVNPEGPLQNPVCCGL